MQNELAHRLEAYLLAARGWVSADELCAAFHVTKRQLRAREDQPGLCSHYAISGFRGFRHVAHCTQAEFDQACRRITAHAEGELARGGKLRQRRCASKPVRFGTAGRDIDQALLLIE